jgi:hypothetical protein
MREILRATIRRMPQSQAHLPSENGDDARPTLLLVDGSSYLYRAYHALPNLRSGSRPSSAGWAARRC